MPFCPCLRAVPAVLALFTASVCAAEPPLTLAAALAEAAAQSPRLRAAELAAAQARQSARAAAAWPGPEVEVSPLTSNQRGADWDADVSQALYDPTLAPAARAARAAWSAAGLDLEEARRDLRADVQTAFVGLVAAQRQVAARQQELDLVRKLRDAAAKARDIGERPGVEVLRADLELSRAEQELLAAEAGADQARAALNSRLGRDLQAGVTVEEVLFGRPAIDRLALVELALTRPRLRSAALRVEQQRALASARRGELAPAVRLGGWRDHADQEHGVRVTVAFPLFDSGRIRGDAAAAATGARVAEQELEVDRREVRLEVEQAVVAVADAGRRRSAYTDAILRQAERLMALTEFGYQTGERSQLELLDARRQLGEVRRATIDLDRALSEALVELQRAVGDLPLQAAPLTPVGDAQ
ncbi:MAG: TolC family protein [Armatimonadetes bacterium]|nr:TolC family protein [Armatimonadota bacterium]